MKFPLNILLIVITALFSSCGGGAPDAVKGADMDSTSSAFKWIEGKYIVINEGAGFYYEEWFKIDNNNYTGTGYALTLDCVDTVFSMKMRLMHEKDKTTLFYDVKNQNENKETEFTLTKGENNVYVFENPFRDFPSIMQYKILGDSVIEVTERGFAKNKEKVIEYRATKMN
ncbi:MAG: hypothetical protein IPJ32_15050 [Sphingobacteriaceae bacterium]|nr:hypothetical protein [Sphingobacteriaceae bacterium]